MTDTEKLTELLRPWIAHLSLSVAKDLIANGVTFARKKRQPANLVGKCGSCAYAEPRHIGRTGVVRTVTCTNEEHLKRHKSPKNYVGGIAARDKTRKACKRYVPKEENT